MFDVLPDIPRIYTAIAEFLSCLLYILYFRKNKFRKNDIVKICLMGTVQMVLQVFAGYLPLNYWVPSMLLNLFWMYLTIYWNTNLSLKYSVYTSLKAFAIAEFIASLAWQVYTFFLWNKYDISKIGLTIFIIVFYIIMLTIIYYIEKKQDQKSIVIEYDVREIIITAFIISIIFFISNIGFLLNRTVYNLGNYVAIYSMRTVVNFCGLSVIFLMQTQKYDRYLKEEIDKINNIFSSRQYSKYVAYKENYDLIQQKLHDLKHQVYIIKTEENNDTRNEQIDVIIEELNNMSANIDTGNIVLDTILTSKNIYCIEQKIVFSCIADGKLLNFLDVADICSIFGNAFDNAIENVVNEKSLERRLINLRIIEKQQFVLIRFENYCTEELCFEDGLPITTKKDKQNHGYGLKSIRYTAEKYNGTMTVGYENNWFTVKILLPKKK